MPRRHIETLHPPTSYSPQQLRFAWTIHAAMNRGKLVLAEPPDPQ